VSEFNHEGHDGIRRNRKRCPSCNFVSFVVHEIRTPPQAPPLAGISPKACNLFVLRKRDAVGDATAFQPTGRILSSECGPKAPRNPSRRIIR